MAVDACRLLLAVLVAVAGVQDHDALFGPGQQEQTTIETDGGSLIRKTITYHNSGGTALK